MSDSNQAADTNPKALRLSIDCKAKVKIGNLSRNGKARGLEAQKANDHDNDWESILVPFGILDVLGSQLSIYFGQSSETSDFIVDCIEAWWQEHRHHYPGIEELAIDLDGGSAVRSNRTQFIKRMVEFVQATGLKVRLIYYPPYHSKYNPIERCWAALENYWNGTVLNSIEKTLQWASNMTWNGFAPFVYLVDGVYPKQISVPDEELIVYKQQWQQSELLPKWDVTIAPL